MEAPLTIDDVAAILKCHARTVRRIRRSALPYFKAGRARQYLPSAVQAYMEQASQITPKPRKERPPSCGFAAKTARRTTTLNGATQTRDEPFRSRLAKWRREPQKLVVES